MGLTKTPIEWCDFTVNPIRARNGNGNGHFCEKISAGCANCFASRLQLRFRMPEFGGGQQRNAVELYLHRPALDAVLSRRKPARIFWCDMTDMFGEWVPDEWIDQCLAVMALTPHLTHLVLTKRAKRMQEYMASDFAQGRRWWNIEDHTTVQQTVAWTAKNILGCSEGFADAIARLPWPLPNVHLGVSIESRLYLTRLDDLRETPAAVRFVSLEPLLEDLGKIDLTGISVAIIGGESGPRARPCNLDWIRDIMRQCKSVGIPIFVKQLGSNSVVTEGAPAKEYPTMRIDDCGGVILRNRKGADPQEWPEDFRVRELA